MVVLKEANNMFWALFLEAGKRYSQKVERPFHISMAALEIPADHDQLKAKHNSVVSVMCGMDKGEFLLSSLNFKAIYQQPLDLNFSAGDEVTFFLNGEGNVHLTGYLMEEEPELDGSMFDDEDIGDLEEEDTDEDVPELVPAKGAKRKKDTALQPAKKLKWITDEAEEIEEDLDEGSEEELDSDMDDEEIEFEEEEDDEEEDSDEEDFILKKIVPKKKEKQTPQLQKTPKQDKQQNKDQGQSGKKEKKNQQAQQTKSPPATPANKAGPEGDASESKKKKKKKKKKKNQGNEPDSTPQQSSSDKKPQTPNQAKMPKKQVLAGGTVMEEIRSGSGQEAKPGKMVHVYYVGKLQKDGRQFDSCTGGTPFRFRLGSQEVIKGWDTGLSGMKVGGKRKLTIPPQQAYGNQKMGGIPPNSTLVFEVELKNVS